LPPSASRSRKHTTENEANEVSAERYEEQLIPEYHEQEQVSLEEEIDKITKKKVAHKRGQLKGGKVKKMDNLPPRRIKKADTKDLFPQIGIDNDEQRRLAKIAGSISGLANQLAEQ